MDLKEAQLSDYQVAKRHPWELARKKVVVDLVKRFIPHIPDQSAKVLDMGCGDVWLVEQLSKEWKKASFQAVDIAFSEDMVKQINDRLSIQHLPIRAFTSMEEGFSFWQGEKINLVLLLDVIEHIEDDIAFLQYLRTHPGIDENTHILITVPAYQFLFSAHDTFLAHYRRYTNHLLAAHLTQANIIPLHQGYFFSSLLFPRMIQKLGELIKPREATGVGIWKGSDQQSKAFVQVLWTDYKISRQMEKIGIKLPGLSNYTICKISV